MLQEEGENEKLLEDLEEILCILRLMMRCEVLGEVFRYESILGLTSRQLREQSHDPLKNYGDCSNAAAVMEIGKVMPC